MKIVSWNCNMAFRNKYEPIIQMQPDLIVLQECENIERLKRALDNFEYRDIIWHGENPHKGIAVISFNGYHIELQEDFNQDIEYVLPLHLTYNDNKVNLLNIWAMPHKTKKKSYVGQVWDAINYYTNILNEDSILIGDFNSNAIWDHERQPGNHTDVVRFLKVKNIQSLYHTQNDEIPGKESQPTIYLLKNMEKPYHLDYCFCSQSLTTANTKITVGLHKDWIKLSDHMPLVVEGLDF